MPQSDRNARRSSSDSRVFVVLPAFDEEAAIAEAVAGVRALYENVVVVDDGSSDETAVAARSAGAIVVQHAVNRGQGAALQTGIEFAIRNGADIVVTFDSDGQHDPADIARLLGPVEAGQCDVALGSRFLGPAAEVPRARRLLLRAAVVFTRLFSGVSVTDAHNGLRAMSRKAAAAIEIRLDRMAHASEIIDSIRRARLRFIEVPVSIRYTDYSKRKGQKATAALRIAVDYLIGRWLR